MNATELKERMASLPPFDVKPPHYTWERNRYELRQHVASEANPASNFLQWSTMIATMVVLDAPYIKSEFKDTPRWLIPDEVDFGGIQRLPWANWTSGNAVHQAHHLWQLLKGSQITVSDMNRIFEFGGGYGAMCRLCRKMGFGGEYVLYDTPEFSLVQEYYLSNVAPHPGNRILTALPEGEVDLFIGLYSMSEVSVALREKALATVPAKSYLFAYKENYEGIDNVAWFASLALEKSHLNWHLYSHPYLGKEHWYAVGAP